MKQTQFLLAATLFFCCANAFSQALPIAIDGLFNDWAASTSEQTDPSGDGNNHDFLRCKIANDEDFIFLQIEMAEETNLTEDNEITLYLDTDLNANTGDPVNGIGAELTLFFGEKEAAYDLSSGTGFLDLHDLGFRHQPTVTSTRFELAIARQADSNAGFPLFTASGVRVFWKDEQGNNGDGMPANGQFFTYSFDETTVPPYEPVLLEKQGENLVRIVTWNTLNNGLEDNDRIPFFDRVMGALAPDIVTFNECWDVTAPQVATFMNVAVPIGNFQSWQAVKLDQGNVTASRWPILQSWSVFPGHRLTASLIDLPDASFSHDLLVVNGHLKCCGDGDFDRQREADAFVEFILDAKTPGGEIDLPEGTPFLLSGDLNLVGEAQQLTTLLTGDVVNTAQFGPGGPMDWDGSDLLDIIALQADQRMAFTWENTSSDFPPSRLDFHIVSGSALAVEKAYSLNTRIIPNPRLDEYGLTANDTWIASDHLPKVTDLRLTGTTPAREVAAGKPGLHIFPNPALGEMTVSFVSEWGGEVNFALQNVDGQTIRVLDETMLAGKNTFTFDVSGLPSGVYFLKMNSMAGRMIVR